jgi:hypothetical protein
MSLDSSSSEEEDDDYTSDSRFSFSLSLLVEHLKNTKSFLLLFLIGRKDLK